jgi:probable addiction module antidote protein
LLEEEILCYYCYAAETRVRNKPILDEPKGWRQRGVRRMTLKTTEFDPAEYLTDGETVAAYLTDALENDDARGVVDALADVVRARGGVDRLAQETSLPREVVEVAVNTSEAPDFDAVLKVMHALGVRLTASLVA